MGAWHQTMRWRASDRGAIIVSPGNGSRYRPAARTRRNGVRERSGKNLVLSASPSKEDLVGASRAPEWLREMRAARPPYNVRRSSSRSGQGRRRLGVDLVPSEQFLADVALYRAVRSFHLCEVGLVRCEMLRVSVESGEVVRVCVSATPGFSSGLDGGDGPVIRSPTISTVWSHVRPVSSCASMLVVLVLDVPRGVGEVTMPARVIARASAWKWWL
jgi:hypothetical protein